MGEAVRKDHDVDELSTAVDKVRLDEPKEADKLGERRDVESKAAETDERVESAPSSAGKDVPSPEAKASL